MEPKREIRADICQKVGITVERGERPTHNPPPWVYYVPEKGDRRFNMEHLRKIIYYFDEIPRRNSYSGNTTLATLINQVSSLANLNIGVSPLSTQWNGFKKSELVDLRDAIDDYERIGKPSVVELANYIQSKSDDVSEDRAISIAESKVEGRGAPQYGFTLDDVEVNTYTSIKINK